MHEPNDIYETQFRLFVAQSPFRIGKTANTVRLLSDQQYVDANEPSPLQEVYDAILVEHDYQADRLRAFAALDTAASGACTATTSRRSGSKWKPC